MRHSLYAPMACVLLVGVVHAQDTYLDKWRESSAGQAPAVKLAISTPKATFYMGEMIPLNLAFTSSAPNAFTASSDKGCATRLDGVDVFALDPVESTGDPLGGPQRATAEACLLATPTLLSNTPFSMERILNEWVYFDKPGVYRVYVVSHRAQPAAKEKVSPPIPRWPASVKIDLPPFDPPVVLTSTSNVLTLEIQATPPEWAAEQLAAAVKILDQPVVRASHLAAQPRSHAGSILRFLYTREAAAELVKRWTDLQELSGVDSGWNWERKEIELGVRSSPYIDAGGRIVPAQ